MHATLGGNAQVMWTIACVLFPHLVLLLLLPIPYHCCFTRDQCCLHDVFYAFYHIGYYLCSGAWQYFG